MAKATLAKGSRISGAQRTTLAAQYAKRYTGGESIRKIAEDAGRSYGFVHNVLKESGVDLRGRGGATRGARKAAPGATDKGAGSRSAGTGGTETTATAPAEKRPKKAAKAEAAAKAAPAKADKADKAAKKPTTSTKVAKDAKGSKGAKGKAGGKATKKAATKS